MTQNHLTKAFTEVGHIEPHRPRRKAILRDHPEIRELMGYDRRTIAVTVVVAAVQLALAGGYQALYDAGHVLGSLWLLPVYALLIGAVLAHWLAMSIHECSHNLAARTTLGNRLVSLLANVPTFVPGAMTFYRYHVEHHTYLGVDGVDQDLAHPIEFWLVDNSRWRKLVVTLLFPLVYFLRYVVFARGTDRWEWINLFQMIAVNVALYYAFGWVALAYLALSFWFGHSIHPVAAHFIHEHYVYEDGQETYSYYGPLNHVTFNVGYHYEHHDLMNIPGWRLPEMRRIASEYYEDLVSHDSWTWVLWHYVTDPRIGPYTRIVRSKETFHRERKALKPAPRPQRAKAA